LKRHQSSVSHLGVRMAQLMNCRRWIPRSIAILWTLLWLLTAFSTAVFPHGQTKE
jgi:hypothetical protein